MKVEFVRQCVSCKGTGIYVGIGERDGFAVVCHTCDGTGKETVAIEYQEFTGRKRRKDVHTVIEVNPGITAGLGNGCTKESFGGMLYKDWLAGKPFAPKTEMRQYTCPAWWYQTADYKKKPEWDECGCGRFSCCAHFPNKQACWERWDKEFGAKEAPHA